MILCVCIYIFNWIVQIFKSRCLACNLTLSTTVNSEALSIGNRKLKQNSISDHQYSYKSVWRSSKCKGYIHIKNKLHKSSENLLRLLKFKLSQNTRATDSELTVLYIHHAHIKESLFPTLELKAQDLCRDLKFLLAFYLYTFILNQ